MVFPQLVDAACIDGPSKKLIHLILRVHGLLSTTAMGWMKQQVTVCCVCVCVCLRELA